MSLASTMLDLLFYAVKILNYKLHYLLLIIHFKKYIYLICFILNRLNRAN